jgi:hypothetical protein
MTDKLMASLVAVHDEESFLTFVRDLIGDRKASADTEAKNATSPYAPDAGGWANTTVDLFLEAAHAWAKDSGFGRTHGLADATPWRLFANFLYCGKIYE